MRSMLTMVDRWMRRNLDGGSRCSDLRHRRSMIMHLLADVPRAPETLLDMVRDDVLGLFDLEDTDVPRIAELMEKYRDLPMDFADAALVCAAERSGIRRSILTLDHHFAVYRLPKRARFTLVP